MYLRKIEQLESRTGAVEGDIRTVECRAEGIERNVKDVDQRIDDLEYEDFSYQISDIRDDQSHLKWKIDDLDDDVSRVSSRTSGVEDDVGTLQEKVRWLEESNTELLKEVRELRETLESFLAIGALAVIALLIFWYFSAPDEGPPKTITVVKRGWFGSYTAVSYTHLTLPTICSV